MRYLSILLINIISVCYASAWTKVAHKDGINIYVKDNNISPIQTLKATSVIEATIENVTAVLRKVEDAKFWVPKLKDRKYIKNISDTEAILYDVNDMPWPIKDRELIVHHHLKLSDDRSSLILEFKSLKDFSYPINDNNIRALFHKGYIKFTPIANKSTEIEMVILVDPMGSIPKWVVNLLQVDMPYDFIRALNIKAKTTNINAPKGIRELILQLK